MATEELNLRRTYTDDLMPKILIRRNSKKKLSSKPLFLDVEREITIVFYSESVFDNYHEFLRKKKKLFKFDCEIHYVDLKNCFSLNKTVSKMV